MSEVPNGHHRNHAHAPYRADDHAPCRRWVEGLIPQLERGVYFNLDNDLLTHGRPDVGSNSNVRVYRGPGADPASNALLMGSRSS